MEDSLKKRYSFKLFSSIISGLIGAILIAIIPKVLGPIAYGQFVYLQDFFMKIINFLDMGSSIAFFTKLSAQHTRKELITFYFIYSILILFLVFIFIGMVEFFDFTENLLPDIPNEYILMGLLFGFFTWFTQVLIKISDAYALTVSVELIKIAHKVLSLLLLLYFVYFTAFNINNYFYYHFIVLLSFFVLLSFLFIKKGIFTKKSFNLNFEFKSLLKEFIEYCSPLIPYSILAVVVGLFDIWLLQKMAGSIQMGFYGLAYSLAAMCFVFTSSMTPIITREFAKSFKQKDLAKMRKLFFKYIPMLYSLAAYFGVFMAIQSETILDIFTDDKFKDAYLVLFIMAFYPIHQTYGQLSGSIFYSTGQTKLIRNIAFISQPIGVLLSFSFIYLLGYGAVGLAMKMVIGQWVGTNILLYYNSKFLGFKMKTFVFHQIYSILLFVLLAYIASNIIHFESSVIYFLVAGSIYTFFVIIVTIIVPSIFGLTRSNIIYIKNKLIRND